ncbi:V-type ATP synthase subunit I [Treponema sp. J25]|nr:V-type ATP synthase subunit I [Treponema sp. J25]
MIRPKPMKYVEITLLARDVDRVLEQLGKMGVLHFSLPEGEESPSEEATGSYAEELSRRESEGLDKNSRATKGTTSQPSVLEKIEEQIRQLGDLASYLKIALSFEPSEVSALPTAEDELFLRELAQRIEKLREEEQQVLSKKQTIEEALREARAFAGLRSPFQDMEQLSYLTLRIGKLDMHQLPLIQEALGERAVVVPLGDGERVIAASSRKGRFALDSELKKAGFVALKVPEGFTGVPEEMIQGLETSVQELDMRLKELVELKEQLVEEVGPQLERLAASFGMAKVVENLKSHLVSTSNAYTLSGWIPADVVYQVFHALVHLTDGRIAFRSYDPEEIPAVQKGKEKVPVVMDHGAFVRGFERVVFSYGAPLYGSIDPTPFVAFFFTLLFGIMFGDLGQGAILFLLGLLIQKAKKGFLSRFKKYGSPLVAVGVAAMIVGLLDGEVFANEQLLIRPTRAITGFLTGHPVDRIITLMPEKGNLEKLFIFFGFTLGVGVLINSVGLIINIVNKWTFKKYEEALFAKTGLAGALFFWYALYLGIRVGVLHDAIHWFDGLGLGLPLLALFFGPLLWRFLNGQKPLFEHGAMAFVMEGFVQILETLSGYISNTVSFLRVGAFALSHAVLSFIVFSLASMLARQGGVGSVGGLVVMILGNGIIILLEGMIVAIQVVRLQYYEFFSKFFTETGVEYDPFRFKREVA